MLTVLTVDNVFAIDMWDDLIGLSCLLWIILLVYRPPIALFTARMFAFWSICSENSLLLHKYGYPMYCGFSYTFLKKKVNYGFNFFHTIWQHLEFSLEDVVDLPSAFTGPKLEACIPCFPAFSRTKVGGMHPLLPNKFWDDVGVCKPFPWHMQWDATCFHFLADDHGKSMV